MAVSLQVTSFNHLPMGVTFSKPFSLLCVTILEYEIIKSLETTDRGKQGTKNYW